MKLLLVTDTHGQLDILNDLANQNSADAIIHAGDFGFYDETSIYRLSKRELKLHIIYSGLSKLEKEKILARPHPDKNKFVRDYRLLGDLPSYLSGKKRFEKPVYAVWGNHEDVEVVKKFHTGEYSVEGLHVLHEQSTFHIDNLHIFGLGGNLLMGRKFFQRAIAGGSGKIWSVLDQYLRLLKTVMKNAQEKEKRILVSHVSPGKESFITLMGIHTVSNLIVSGHMDPPFSMIWNEFAIRSPEEAIDRVQQRLSDVRQAYDSLNLQNNGMFEDTLTYLTNFHNRALSSSEQDFSAWYRNMININLPDVPNGYALLETNGDVWKIKSKC